MLFRRLADACILPYVQWPPSPVLVRLIPAAAIWWDCPMYLPPFSKVSLLL